MFRTTRVALGLLFLALCCVPSAFAQGGTGQLSGNVADANGAVVTGASVKLTSLVTAQERETTTNDSGDFVFTLLASTSICSAGSTKNATRLSRILR